MGFEKMVLAAMFFAVGSAGEKIKILFKHH